MWLLRLTCVATGLPISLVLLPKKGFSLVLHPLISSAKVQQFENINYKTNFSMKRRKTQSFDYSDGLLHHKNKISKSTPCFTNYI